MTTIPTTTIDAARAIDLVSLAERYGVELRGNGREREGPCPKCGGSQRFHIRDNAFFCRDCRPFDAGRGWGDPIEFVQWIGAARDFKEAIAILTGHQAHGPQPIPPAPPAPKRTQQPDATWTAKATRIADEAATRLFTDPYAEVGRDYLLQRGIEPAAWAQFKLGYRPDFPLPRTWDAEKREYMQPRYPAIVIPWYRGGKVTAIQYRFLCEDKHEVTKKDGTTKIEKGHRYLGVDGQFWVNKTTNQPGGTRSGILYGGHALPSYTSLPVSHSNGKRVENMRTLVLCEGELNAISIWQVAERWKWDVLSLGSESAKLSQGAVDYARHFGRVLVWMDRPPVVKELMAALNSGLLMPVAHGVNSPPREGGGKYDANDLLQAGQLGEFLARWRAGVCQSAEERRAFRFDLQEAAETLQGIDEGTRKVMGEL